MNKTILFGLMASMTMGHLWLNSQPAQAFVIEDGWRYEIDVYNDGTAVDIEGNSLFELYGLAYRVAEGVATVAISSNMDLENGAYSSSALDRRLDFGDILINYSGKNLQEASDAQELFGIRFAPNSDSGVDVGIYSNVEAQLAVGNSQWDSLKAYNDYLALSGITPSIGDGSVFNNVDEYFGGPNGKPVNSIASGNRIGDISMLSPEEVANLALDFGQFFPDGKTGTERIAFTFDTGVLPQGEALYHLALECNNDLIGGYFDPMEDTPVPTPTAILPSLFGLFGMSGRKKRMELKK